MHILYRFVLQNVKTKYYSTPSGNRTRAPRFQVQHAPPTLDWALACKTETLGIHYIVMLYWSLTVNISSPKIQVVHEQKFKDLLSSTCLSSSERSMLELQSRGLGSIPTRGGVIFCLIHFVTQIYTILPDTDRITLCHWRKTRISLAVLCKWWTRHEHFHFHLIMAL